MWVSLVFYSTHPNIKFLEDPVSILLKLLVITPAAALFSYYSQACLSHTIITLITIVLYCNLHLLFLSTRILFYSLFPEFKTFLLIIKNSITKIFKKNRTIYLNLKTEFHFHQILIFVRFLADFVFYNTMEKKLRSNSR